MSFAVHENGSQRTGSAYLLSTRKLYLPTGRYRLKVSLEGQLFWASLTLSPRSVQRKTPDTANGQTVVLHQENGPSLPLSVRYSVYDADTSENITPEAKVLVLMGDRWLPLFLAKVEGLFPGRTYTFRVEREGVFPLGVGGGVDQSSTGPHHHAAIATMKKNGTYLVLTLDLGDWFLKTREDRHAAELIAKAREVTPAARKNVARSVRRAESKSVFWDRYRRVPDGLHAQNSR